jgi:gluconate 2-dehydrogenase gamma chain
MNRREAIQKTAMMLGYAVSIPAITGVLNGCQAQPGLAFKPVFFNEDQARSVEILSEIIIPKTSTPGAIDVGVPSFIDRMLKEVYAKPDQDEFLQGLAGVNQDANKEYGNNFSACSTSEQSALFKKYHDDAFAVPIAKPALGWWNPRPAEKKPFILHVKELVLLGFFTSQIGASEVLKYKQVPGPFKGCVPFADVGKTWAT